MRVRRGTGDDRLLCAGPGRLTQALGVTRAHDGMSLDTPPFGLAAPATRPPIVAGPRIGISRNADAPWRFGLAGSRWVSRPFAAGLAGPGQTALR